MATPTAIGANVSSTATVNAPHPLLTRPMPVTPRSPSLSQIEVLVLLPTPVTIMTLVLEFLHLPSLQLVSLQLAPPPLKHPIVALVLVLLPKLLPLPTHFL